jgi:hypothetical protein
MPLRFEITATSRQQKDSLVQLLMRRLLGVVAKQPGIELSEISLQTLHDANYRRLKNTVLRHFGSTEFDNGPKRYKIKRAMACAISLYISTFSHFN